MQIRSKRTQIHYDYLDLKIVKNKKQPGTQLNRTTECLTSIIQNKNAISFCPHFQYMQYNKGFCSKTKDHEL